MANYNTNLSDWGATGEKPPSGYAYEEDVPPVDLYDNYLMDNVINDIQHLTSLTNDRLESEAGTSRPSSPEGGHLFADTDNGKFEWYDPASGAWRRALDATGDKLDGVIDMGGYQIEDSTGSLTLDGNVDVSNGQLLEQSNRVATRTWATGSNILHIELADAPASAHHTRYSDSEARSAVEAGSLSQVKFSNIESVGNRSIGIDDSEGPMYADLNGNHYLLWNSNHVNGGNAINISGGSGSGSSPVSIDHVDTSSQGDVTTGGATVIDDIYVDGNGHVTNLNTQNRSLDDWNSANGKLTLDREGIQSSTSWMEISGNGEGLLINYASQGDDTRFYGQYVDATRANKFGLPNRSSDPSASAGDMWYRTDLD